MLLFDSLLWVSLIIIFANHWPSIGAFVGGVKLWPQFESWWLLVGSKVHALIWLVSLTKIYPY